MTGLPWVRLDTGFPSNPKILGLIADRKSSAAFGYVCALAWSGGHGTDGFIPEIALSQAWLTPESASSGARAGLFIPVPGGYQIHDWADYKQTTAETTERSAKAQAAARIRWQRVAAQQDASSNAKRIASGNANGNAKRNAEQNRTEQST